MNISVNNVRVKEASKFRLKVNFADVGSVGFSQSPEFPKSPRRRIVASLGKQIFVCIKLRKKKIQNCGDLL